MISQQKLAKLLGSDDRFIAQYFGHGFTGKLQAWIFRSRLKMLKDNLRRIQFKPRMTLDVGCGPMFISCDLIGNGEGQYIGVDMMARSRLKKYRDAIRNMVGEAVETVRASGVSLPFQDRTFDFVLSLDVLEHLKKPKKCAIEIGRTVKNSGIIAISLPLENVFQRLLRISFFLMKITGDPTVKRVKLNKIIRWMVETPQYHYCGNIKSYAAMTKMLEELFNSLYAGYTPLGLHKSINVNAVLFFRGVRMTRTSIPTEQTANITQIMENNGRKCVTEASLRL